MNISLTDARKTLAAARKSSVFPPVQDPIYTRSIFTSLHSLAKARLSGECGCKITFYTNQGNYKLGNWHELR